MKRFKIFTGGVLDTNCYLYEAPAGAILFDAPQGADAALSGTPIALLALTHGHFDHVADAAAIIRRHHCRATFHPDTAPIAADPGFFRQWGFALDLEPFAADFLVDESHSGGLLGADVRIFHVPGHCPGSLCFFLPGENTLVGGDVLFRGSVGRWDLPGGDRELLRDGIRQKLLALDDSVTVLPGHGPPTTIGHERRENDFLQD